MLLYSEADICGMDRRFRTNFMNSLLGFKPVNLLGTIDEQGSTNLAVFSGVVHLGADPPLIGVVFRPHTVSRHTLENIQKTRQFTVNQVNTQIIEPAHHSSAKYPRELSEFEVCGLDPHFISGFKAPFVRESRVRLGVEMVEIIPITHNNTSFLVGQIVLVEVDAELIRDDGFIDPEKAGSTAVAGLNHYYSGQLQKVLPYARPLPDGLKLAR